MPFNKSGDTGVEIFNQVSTEKEVLNERLLSGRVDQVLKSLEDSGWLKGKMPEIAALKDCEQGPPYHLEGNVFQHTLLVGENLPPEAGLRLKLAAIFHDIAKPETRKEEIKDGRRKVSFFKHDSLGAEKAPLVLRRIGFSEQETEDISWLVAHHQDAYAQVLNRLAGNQNNPENFKKAKKFFIDLLQSKESRPGLVDDLIELAVADNKGKVAEGLTAEEQEREIQEQEALIRAVYAGAREDIKELEKYSLVKKLKLGALIQEYGQVKPGPELGKIKKELEDYLIGQKPSSIEEAEVLVKNYFKAI